MAGGRLRESHSATPPANPGGTFSRQHQPRDLGNTKIGIHFVLEI